MLRLNKLTDYAVVILSEMACGEAGARTAADLAERTGVGKPTVNKLLKLLAGQGIVRSIRGRNGGYVLARSAARIPVTEIIEAIEGPMAITECSSEGAGCERGEHCSLKPHWQRINDAIRDTLSGITLEELSRPVPQPVTYWAAPDQSEDRPVREASGGK